MKKERTTTRKWIFRGFALTLIVVLVSALIWYQPWRLWQAEQLIEHLQSSDIEVRGSAMTELYSWRLIQRQRLLQQSQPQLLAAYEQAINNALLKSEWRNAQLWLQDLQRLYPQLPAVQASQQKVSSYVAQQINSKVAQINQLLNAHRFLTPTSVAQLQTLQTELAELAPDHALLNDKRIMYALLLSIDEALAMEDFTVAQHLLNWGLPRFPEQAQLQDRQVQVNYKLAGRPSQVLATCIAQGQDCWKISTSPALFSQPWLLQYHQEYPGLAQWQMTPILQERLGDYYRKQALEAYGQQQFMQASVDLLRASYFGSTGELNEYWQWLAFAFIEREQKEYQQAQLAQLAGLHHTLISQVAALDVVGAQNTVVAMQALGADPWFTDQIALPMLGETYLKLAQQLAMAEQYEVAMRLLIAGERFLPQDGAIAQLLAEYKESTTVRSKAPSFSTDNSQLLSLADTSLLDAAALQVLGFPNANVEPNPATVNAQESCDSHTPPTPNAVRTCQDQLSAQVKGPLLVVPPANQRFVKPFAISKYPISIKDYNHFCHTSGSCSPRALPQEKAKELAPKNSQEFLGDFDLTDVQKAVQEYDEFCRNNGTCSSIEPQAQDLPLTDIKLEEALSYVRWLSAVTGQTYRLPMVDEWRYAILSDEIYRCSYDTLLKLPKKLLPVQQGVSNRWGIVHELVILKEWVYTPEGIAVIGPEKPENLPICILPVNNNKAAARPDVNTGMRVVREL